MEASVPFEHIVRALEDACRTGQTGRLHIVTSKNHKATFTLERGRISGVSYRIRRGLPALEAVLTIKSGRWRLEQTNHSSAPDPSLPDTQSILLQLNSVLNTLPVPATPPAPPQPSSRQPLAYLPMKLQIDLTALFTSYVGPIAGLLVPSALGSAETMEAALELLAQDIPDAQAAQRFKQEAWTLLNTI